MASRPTSPTSAHGYHQELMAAVPSKEPRQAPQDGAGHVMEWPRNACSCRSAHQMLRSAALKRKPFVLRQLLFELLFPFQAYSLPFQAEQQFKNSTNSTHACPATEGSGVTKVPPRHRISIPYHDLSCSHTAIAKSLPSILYRNLYLGPPPPGTPTL